MIIDTIEKTSITTNLTIKKNPEPTKVTMTASPDNNFMFGVELYGLDRLNLNDNKRYFDVLTGLYSGEAGQFAYKELELVPCTREHWASLPDLVKNFDSQGIAFWMCPPLGASFDIYGKLTSENFQQISILVYPCNNATDPSRPCASQSEIDALFAANGNNLYFTYYFINTVINPDNPHYIDYYL